MKRIVTAATTVFVLGALTVPVLAASPSAPSSDRLQAAAQPNTSAAGHGAVVMKHAPCFLPLPAPGRITTDSHVTISPSGNTTVICHARTARSGKTFSGFEDDACVTPAGVLTRGHLVVTRSGRINMSCHVHPRSGAPAQTNGPQHRWQHGAVAGFGPAAVGRKLGHIN